MATQTQSLVVAVILLLVGLPLLGLAGASMFWVLVCGAGGIAALAHGIRATTTESPGTDDPLPVHPPAPPPPPARRKTAAQPGTHKRDGTEEGPTFTYSSPNAEPQSYGIPRPPAGYGAARWVKTHETVDISGRRIGGGLFYFGTSLPSSQGANDPCLIDPSKNVAAKGDFTLRQTDYWPSYSTISGAARASYLAWLASGRRHPDADIGFVFLFFYGLERRVLLDAPRDTDAAADLPAIERELAELLSVYGEKSGSFLSCATSLVAWIQLVRVPARLYERALGPFTRSYELPIQLRVALGQAALDGQVLSPQLALTWVRAAPEVGLRTPAWRCEPEFNRLFVERYRDAYGAGTPLQRTRSKLHYAYRPASSGFMGSRELKLDFGGLPDIALNPSIIHKLRDLADKVTAEVEAFSRYLGRNPEGRSSLEGALLLPPAIWPVAVAAGVQELVYAAAAQPVLVKCQELLDKLGATASVNKDRFCALTRALGAKGIGVEPDVLGGARVPKAEDPVVLFTIPPGPQALTSSPGYRAALLTIQLAGAVAAADGDFSDAELAHLSAQIRASSQLSAPQQARLLAHLQFLRAAPISVATLAKQFEPLDGQSREMLARFMASVAQADGVVSPAEVKLLEKVYKALGIDSKKVFSDLHAVAAGGGATPAASAGGFKLDAARIAALQKDTEEVSALLAQIFRDDAEPAVAEALAVDEVEDVQRVAGPLGLDEAHEAMARRLLAQSEWARAELEDAAADLDLMLDGALERINEAAFDRFDMPYTEGDDPIVVNPDILEKLAA